MISPGNSRLGLIALTKRLSLADRPDNPEDELIKYRVSVLCGNLELSFHISFSRSLDLILSDLLVLPHLVMIIQWDDPRVIPADMSLEVAELFTRELTRVTTFFFFFSFSNIPNGYTCIVDMTKFVSLFVVVLLVQNNIICKLRKEKPQSPSI